MTSNIDRNAPNWPQDAEAVKHVERLIELGNLGELLPPFILSIPRYLVTYMNSQTQDSIRSATVVTVTNQSNFTNRVTVSFYKGLSNAPVSVLAYSIPPEFTIDFCSRSLPGELTTGNSISSPELVFDEGRAIVSSVFPEIGVSSRVYYTQGDGDERLLAITDSKIVAFGQGNNGD